MIERPIIAIKWGVSWLRSLLRTERWKYLLGGTLIGLLVAHLLFPETRSACFWMVSGVILSFVIGIIWHALKQFAKQLATQTRIGRLLGPIHVKGEKCIVFVTEYWRDVKAGNLYNYDKTIPLRGTDRVMGTGDSGALQYIYGLLMKAGKSYKEIFMVKSYKELEENFTENFISIGGLTNKATASLMEDYRAEVDYFFSPRGNLIIRDYGECRKYIRSDRQHDYGIIMKKSRLNHKDKVLYVIAGIGGLGTTAAAYYLLENATDLGDEYHKKDFSLIIGVKRHVGEKSAFRVDFDQLSRELI